MRYTHSVIIFDNGSSLFLLAKVTMTFKYFDWNDIIINQTDL